MNQRSHTPRRLLSTLLALAVGFPALLAPGLARAEEPVCIPYSADAQCIVDGKPQPCDLDALPPEAMHYLNVDADEAGVVYLASVSATEAIQLTKFDLAKGDNRFPESGSLKPIEGGNFGLVLVTSTASLDALEPFVGKTLAAGSKDHEALKTTMMEIFNAHGICRTDTPPPPPTGGSIDDLGAGAPEPEPDTADEEEEDDGLSPPEGTKGGGKVHVEPELLD